MSSDSDDDDIAQKIKEESDSESEKEKDKKNKENLEEKQKKKDEMKEKENKKEDKKEDKKDEEKEMKAAKGKENKKKQESSDSGSSDNDSSEKDKKKKKSTKEADSRKDKNEKQKEKSEDKNSKKEEPKASKKRKESSSSSDSSSESNKKDDKKKDKDNKKNVDSDDEKEGENKNKKKENQDENADKIKEKKEKEEKEKKEKEEKERLERQKQKEIEAKEREEREKDRERRNAKKETDGGGNDRGNDRFERRNDGGFNNRGNDRFDRRNDGGRPFGRGYYDNPPREEINYVQKQAKKYDNNEVKALKSIISENEEIITEMKNAYPEITKLECANVIKNIKNSNAQTIFEIMNLIHREISIQITLNNNESNREIYILPNDPFEIIDPLYNNQEHIKVMKYYKVYSNEDKEKLPTYVQKMLSNDFYYTDNSTRRRPLIKYSNGAFNYIPIKCEKSEECNKENCPYSHTDNEMFYHPLYYKTRFYNSEKEGYNSKNANDYINDFRIIYNYKNQNIINLLKLLDEKKIAKSNFRDYYKKKNEII